jgi:hypothetical protein
MGMSDCYLLNAACGVPFQLFLNEILSRSLSFSPVAPTLEHWASMMRFVSL